jgi:uncharacterized protein YjiS (DUF1127 family)
MRTTAFMTSRSAAAAAPAEGPLARLARQVVLRFRLWRIERRTLAEIARLDDATLRDIGVSRWQLHEHVRAERERPILREAGARYPR